MNSRKKIYIILTCIVLILGAFGYSYYATIRKLINETPNEKPGTRINIKSELSHAVEENEGVAKFPAEDRVTPSTILVEIKVSRNTGVQVENKQPVPDIIVGLTQQEVEEYYSNHNYDSVEFNNDKIVITKIYPYLPNRFLVKLDDKYIRVYSTDDNGAAEIVENFPEMPCKNKDEDIIRGIEVETMDEAWQRIGDYE